MDFDLLLKSCSACCDNIKIFFKINPVVNAIKILKLIRVYTCFFLLGTLEYIVTPAINYVNMAMGSKNYLITLILFVLNISSALFGKPFLI